MRSPFFKSILTTGQPEVEQETPRPDDKEAAVSTEPQHSSDHDTDDDAIEKDAQAGVQNIEGITKVWSTRDLYLAYILYAHRKSLARRWFEVDNYTAFGLSTSSMLYSKAWGLC
jgi:hypothetical protein